MTFQLARFRKKLQVKGGYEYERAAACVSGAWLHTWRRAIDGAERVLRRKFVDAASATRAFGELLAEHRRDGFAPVPDDEIGWTINPRGMRGYYKGGAWASPRPWGADVEVTVVERPHAPGARAIRTASPAPIAAFDPARLAKLARGGRPTANASFGEVVQATNSWFESLVAAGLPLESIPGAASDPVAIRTTGPYPASVVRAAERELRAPPPRKLALRAALTTQRIRLSDSYVSMLRSVGDVAVLGPRGRETTHPIAKHRAHPLRSTLVEATHVLNWEVERHGQRGSFRANELANRRWLRFAGNAPGGSDHTFIMDLARSDDAGEPAIYRVPDVDLPTEIERRATVYGVRAWLLAQIRGLRAMVQHALD